MRFPRVICATFAFGLLVNVYFRAGCGQGAVAQPDTRAASAKSVDAGRGQPWEHADLRPCVQDRHGA